MDGLEDFCLVHFAERREVGVAERTRQVAARQPDEDGCPASVVAFTLQGVEYLVDPHFQCSTSILNGIDGHIALALLHACLVAGFDLLRTPAGNILGRGVEGQYLVQVLMVDDALDALFDFSKIHDHSILVEFLRTAVDGDAPVVAVRLGALAVIVEHQVVGCRYLYVLFNVIHDIVDDFIVCILFRYAMFR